MTRVLTISRTIFNLVIAGVVYVALILGCTSLPSNSQRTKSPTRTGADSSPTPHRSQWDYVSDEDEMGRGKVSIASIQSENTISLDFPYQGEQYATLALREHPKFGKDVYIKIEKGQLLDSDYHSKVVVRFDSENPMSFPSVRPADLSTEILFLRGSAFPVFLKKLPKAKSVKIEVPVYQAGNQVLTFDVEGFDWKR